MSDLLPGILAGRVVHIRVGDPNESRRAGVRRIHRGTDIQGETMTQDPNTMTREEINAAIAERIMGWKWWKFRRDNGDTFHELVDPTATWPKNVFDAVEDGKGTLEEALRSCPKYSDDLNQAFEALRKSGLLYVVSNDTDLNNCEVALYNEGHEKMLSLAKGIPGQEALTICRALLLAVPADGGEDATS